MSVRTGHAGQAGGLRSLHQKGGCRRRWSRGETKKAGLKQLPFSNNACLLIISWPKKASFWLRTKTWGADLAAEKAPTGTGKSTSQALNKAGSFFQNGSLCFLTHRKDLGAKIDVLVSKWIVRTSHMFICQNHQKTITSSSYYDIWLTSGWHLVKVGS